MSVSPYYLGHSVRSQPFAVWFLVMIITPYHNKTVKNTDNLLLCQSKGNNILYFRCWNTEIVILRCWNPQILKYWLIVILLRCICTEMLQCWNTEILLRYICTEMLKCWDTEIIKCWKTEIWINETLEIQRQGDVEILKCCKEWNTEVLICWNIEMLKMWNTEMLKYRDTKHSSLNNVNITDDLWIFLCRENNVYKYLTCFHWIYKTVMKHHMILVLTYDISVIWSHVIYYCNKPVMLYFLPLLFLSPLNHFFASSQGL